MKSMRYYVVCGSRRKHAGWDVGDGGAALDDCRGLETAPFHLLANQHPAP